MRVIQPQDLVFEWDRVREGLVILKERSVDDWLPEDVYMAIKLNNSALYIAENDQGDYQGFFILQVIPTFHSQRLHVWCAYSATKTPMLRKFLGALKEIATQYGIKKITFNSPRDEWEVVGERGGFKATYTTHQLEI